jgi:hypothetical protein
LGWFRIISLSYVTHSHNGLFGVHTKQEFLPPRPILRFSQRTCSILYFRSKTHVWGGFALHRCRTSPIPKTGVGVHTKNEFLPPEPFLRFSQRTCPIHYFRSKTHVWGCFAKFRCRTSPIPKTGVGCKQSMSFRHRNHFFVIRNEHAQSSTLGPKLMCGVVSLNFVVVRHPFPKWVSGCIQSTSFCHRNQFFVFCNEHAQSSTLGPKLMFGVVSRYIIAARHPFRKRVSGCIKSTSFCHRNHFFVFRNEYAQSTTLGPKLMFGVVSRNFVAARHPFRKRVSGCIQSTSFCYRNHFFVFRNEHAQSTTLGPKLMFGVVSRNFIAARHPFRKRVSGCLQSTSFRRRNQFFVFRNEHAQSTTLGKNSYLGWFRAISLPDVTHSENGCRGAYKARLFATGTISSFFATNLPNPLL